MLSCAVDRKGHSKHCCHVGGGGGEGEEVAHSGWTTPESPQPKVVHTAQALVCSRRPLSKVGMHFMYFPGPRHLGSRVLHRDTDPGGLCIMFPSQVQDHSGGQVLSKHTVPGGLCILCTSLVQAALFPGCTTKTLSQTCHVSPQGSWSQTVTLLANVNHPGSQEDMVCDRQPAHTLAADAVSGAEIAAAPCLPFLAVTHLPLCLHGGRVVNCSGLALLWYSLGCYPLFNECTRRHHGALEPSHMKDPLFLFVTLVFLWFGLLCHNSPLRLSLGHSSPQFHAQPPLAACSPEHLSHSSAGNCSLEGILR